MDIVLEAVDTFVADKVYATLLPAASTPWQFSQNATEGIMYGGGSSRGWEYKPSTYLMYLEPSSAAYESIWMRDNIFRQFITLFFTTWVFGFVYYFSLATLSYVFLFDKETFKHPKFLKNQISLEIRQAVGAMPGLALCTAALFVLEVRGHTRMYGGTSSSSSSSSAPDGPGTWYNWAQLPLFILFTDFCVYWIHRGLHHPLVYKHLHKSHHKWIMPTPFASLAFNPIDGFLQSVPYHAFPMIFPMHKFIFVGAFIFVNIWTILIHDGEYVTDNPVINGSACHSAHHLYFNYNYGQYLTLWDRLGGSYRRPEKEWFDRALKMSKETWKKGVSEMEKIQEAVEGEDNREYSAVDKKNN